METKSISQAKKHLLFHLKGKNLQLVPALVGLTGIGKTAIIKAVADELNADLLYFNMAQMSEGELALPVPVNHLSNDSDALVKYAINHKLQQVLDNPDKQYIVFPDEFTRGTIPVISEWMTIINERQLQGEKFGDNVRFVVAMNPTTSMRNFTDTDYASSELDDAHANRFTFMHIEADVDDWLEWAETANVHPFITQFLSVSHNKPFFYGKESGGVRMRTPRSWDFLSQSLHEAEEQDMLKDMSFLSELIGDQIGYDMADTLIDFIKDITKALTYEDIFTGKPISNKNLMTFEHYEGPKQKVLVDSFIDVWDNSEEIRNKLNDNDIDNMRKLLLAMSQVDARYDTIQSAIQRFYAYDTHLKVRKDVPEDNKIKGDTFENLADALVHLDSPEGIKLYEFQKEHQKRNNAFIEKTA